MVAMNPFDVDRSQLEGVNMQALKRQDEYISDIIETSGHTAVYEFDQITQSWRRRDTEGALFVVKRTAAPRFQLIVNNRLNTSNLVLPIDQTMHADSVEAFLILRIQDRPTNGSYTVYGLWFHPEEDREKIAKILHRIVYLGMDSNTPIAAALPVPPSATTQETRLNQVSNGHGDKKKNTKKGQQNQRSQSKDGSNAMQKQTAKKNPSSQPKSIAILQRPQSRINDMPTQEGKVAGDIILGMISKDASASTAAIKKGSEQNEAVQPVNAAPQPQSSTGATKPTIESRSSGKAPRKAEIQKLANAMSKAELKDTLIALLSEPTFLDTIHQAYLDRIARLKSNT